MLVAPETVVTLRNNVLFETDSGVRLRYLTDPGTWAASRLEFLQHPAFFLVWRPIGLALTSVFRLIAPGPQGAVLAAQTLLCGSAAAGTAALYTVGRRCRLTTVMALLPVAMLILSTATVLVVVPEHWAFAQGMMLVAFWLLMRPGRPGPRTLVPLGLLCILIAGTTITNIVFGMLAVVAVAHAMGMRMPGRNVLAGLAIGATVALLAAGYLVSKLPHVAGFLNLRLVQSPLTALSYMAFGLVAPMIGPVPWQSIERQHLVLSYEPVSFSTYMPATWIPVAAWIALLALCAWHAIRDPETRAIALLCAAWIAFNLVFHNLWGDEFFLYSGHWAWALVALVALGIRHVRPRVAGVLGVVVAAGQILSMLAIGGMLRAGA